MESGNPKPHFTPHASFYSNTPPCQACICPSSPEDLSRSGFPICSGASSVPRALCCQPQPSALALLLRRLFLGLSPLFPQLAWPPMLAPPSVPHLLSVPAADLLLSQNSLRAPCSHNSAVYILQCKMFLEDEEFLSSAAFSSSND
ncbi:hypothetical protein OROGR_011745 [Orobanche gracilis]